MSIARLFSEHAQDYQAVARQAAAFQEQFVANLKTSTAAYTSVEDAIVGLLQGVETGIGSLVGAYDQLVINVITGSESWINLVPPLLKTLVGIPFLSLFIFPLPLLFAMGIFNAIIEAI